MLDGCQRLWLLLCTMLFTNKRRTFFRKVSYDTQPNTPVAYQYPAKTRQLSKTTRIPALESIPRSVSFARCPSPTTPPPCRNLLRNRKMQRRSKMPVKCYAESCLAWRDFSHHMMNMICFAGHPWNKPCAFFAICDCPSNNLRLCPSPTPRQTYTISLVASERGVRHHVLVAYTRGVQGQQHRDILCTMYSTSKLPLEQVRGLPRWLAQTIRDLDMFHEQRPLLFNVGANVIPEHGAGLQGSRSDQL